MFYLSSSFSVKLNIGFSEICIFVIGIFIDILAVDIWQIGAVVSQLVSLLVTPFAPMAWRVTLK